MTLVEYLDAVKERLLTDSNVVAFHIVRERATLTDAHLRARLTLTGNSQIEFSEYVQASPEGQIAVVTYSYHWADAEGHLLKRWDNTPHFPGLPGFPHHMHIGAEEAAAPGRPVDIFAVLDEIASHLK